jgi:acyl carrier protein
MSTTIEEIAIEITEFLKESIGQGATENLTASTSINEMGLLDSLGFMSLRHYLESEYGVQLDEGDITYDNFRTPADIASLIKQYQRDEQGSR